MSEHIVATPPPQMMSLEVTVIRANGKVEHLGKVAYYNRNPLKRWAWAFGRWLRGLRAGSIKMKTGG